ncbi:hypothetical protein JB92DRAFT_3101342, partial [Gautieria morchelliformis]
PPTQDPHPLSFAQSFLSSEFLFSQQDDDPRTPRIKYHPPTVAIATRPAHRAGNVSQRSRRTSPNTPAIGPAPGKAPQRRQESGTAHPGQPPATRRTAHQPGDGGQAEGARGRNPAAQSPDSSSRSSASAPATV